MQDFVHLHVHTQYSLLDGQASVSALVDKAMKDGMKGIAVTDHGNMFGIKEFTNYVNKKNSGPKGEIKDLKKRMAGIESGEIACDDKEAELADCRAKIAEAENKLFKPIIGCEMYVARRTMDKKEGKPDQSGWHLIVLAKNEKGYHNLIKLVSRAWTQGYYMRPRTDRNELEKYHEGLIVCSACIGGEVPKKIINDQLEDAEEAIRWYKNLFGEDYYLELQRHRATIPRANHEAYPLQQKANAKLIEFAKKYNILVVHDNAYSEIEYDGRRGFSFLSIPGAKDVGIEFNSLSKTYNLTGLRISFALGNADVIKHFKTIRSQFDYGTSYIVQKAAVAALNGPQDGVVKQQAQYQSRRDALCDGLNAIGWKVPYSEGTMFVWAPVPKQFKNSDEFCIQMLENTGVVCTPGSAFGSLGENHVRFALVLNENLIKEAVEKIKEWFEKENIEL